MSNTAQVASPSTAPAKLVQRPAADAPAKLSGIQLYSRFALAGAV
jgi:hypothetical protein